MTSDIALRPQKQLKKAKTKQWLRRQQIIHVFDIASHCMYTVLVVYYTLSNMDWHMLVHHIWTLWRGIKVTLLIVFKPCFEAAFDLAAHVSLLKLLTMRQQWQTLDLSVSKLKGSQCLFRTVQIPFLDLLVWSILRSWDRSKLHFWWHHY